MFRQELDRIKFVMGAGHTLFTFICLGLAVSIGVLHYRQAGLVQQQQQYMMEKTAAQDIDLVSQGRLMVELQTRVDALWKVREEQRRQIEALEKALGRPAGSTGKAGSPTPAPDLELLENSSTAAPRRPYTSPVLGPPVQPVYYQRVQQQHPSSTFSPDGRPYVPAPTRYASPWLR